MEQRYYTNERNIQIVISLLKQHGIKRVIASPGATNVTFVASIQQDPWFEIYSSVDERSAAYMACGMAAESGEPVVISCTGATASRNYMPGLTEAFYRKLPVIAITSHQGTHRIGHLIAQQIDRRNPPADIAIESVTVPVVKDNNDERFCEIEVNKALLALKSYGGGPVHINLFTTYSRDYSVVQLPKAHAIRRYSQYDKLPELSRNGHIAVFIGSHKLFTAEEIKALDDFCAVNDAVVFHDHTSGYYGHYGVRNALMVKQHFNTSVKQIDTLIHIGEVSGDYDGFAFSKNRVWRVSEDGALRDSFGKLTDVFQMPEKVFFEKYTPKDEPIHHEFLDECKRVYQKVLSDIPELPFGNIWMAQYLSKHIPSGSNLHLGILNTLRSWNFFDIDNEVMTNCNVGGFGIDGNMSSMIGASLIHPEKKYFGIFGDLSFFYDMNVAGNRHVGNNVRILLINNGRGTEFRNYNHPGAAFGEKADEYIAAARHYGNKSENLVKHYATDLGFEYITASNKQDFLVNVDRFLTPELTSMPILFEVFTDSKDESDALYTINHLYPKDAAKPSMKQMVKNEIKSVIGERGMKIGRAILGKD